MKLTRREILTAFLGLPFALSACRSKTENTEVAGEIVGANVNAGHILRELRNAEVPANNWENIKVAIIGGGAAGLSAAYKFQKENFNDFVLLELESKIGGTAQSGESNIVPYPWGAHYLPVPFQENAELIALRRNAAHRRARCQRRNCCQRTVFVPRAGRESFYKGRWYEGLYLNAGASEDDKISLPSFKTN